MGREDCFQVIMSSHWRRVNSMTPSVCFVVNYLQSFVLM